MRSMQFHPDEDIPRLMFADWCEENGHAERATIFRRPDYPPLANRVSHLVDHPDEQAQHLAAFAVMRLPDVTGLHALVVRLCELEGDGEARHTAHSAALRLAEQLDEPIRCRKRFGHLRAEQRFEEIEEHYRDRTAFLTMWRLVPWCDERRPIIHVAALRALGLYRPFAGSAAILSEIDPPDPVVRQVRRRAWQREVYERSRRQLRAAAEQLLEDTGQHGPLRAWEATQMAVHGAAGIIPGRDRMRSIKIGWWQVGGILEVVTGQTWPEAAFADAIPVRTVTYETRTVNGVATSESRTVGTGAA